MGKRSFVIATATFATFVTYFFFPPLPNERDLPVFDDQFLSNERRLGSKVRNTYDIDVAN